MIQCPTCLSEIPAVDFNVSTDLAYCRQCDFNHQYSELVSGQFLPDPSKAELPKHLSVEDLGHCVSLRYRRLHPVLLFLLPFTALWSGISLIGIYGTQFWKGEFDLQESLFGIPFVVGTLILSSICIFLLFGRWRITLDGPESSVFIGIGPLGWTRRFDLTATQSVRLKLTSLEVNNVRQTGICLAKPDGTEFVFGSTIHEESKTYIAAVIREAIRH